MRARSAIALVAVILMSCGSAYAKHAKPPQPSEFENAEIRVEQNFEAAGRSLLRRFGGFRRQGVVATEQPELEPVQISLRGFAL